MSREQKIHVYRHDGRWYFRYGARPPVAKYGDVWPMVMQMSRFYSWRSLIEAR
jgi:hypothetical protein